MLLNYHLTLLLTGILFYLFLIFPPFTVSIESVPVPIVTLLENPHITISNIMSIFFAESTGFGVMIRAFLSVDENPKTEHSIVVYEYEFL